jgi:hypothetical protein
MNQALVLLDQQEESHAGCYLQNAILIYEDWLATEVDGT